ncbi:hypothetical protein [Corynebacterium efficiens YS-314]|uniref:Uncharacterized protein n=1 Tax=Corynebacterium efficiens (strain DSM 44549 / YS-314 / AJ 12310 / JCM 11189 / NBRC 100395) TaxID=196164 RepID=Q8FSU5_COREF|nr:hypothetical protein [Corynebacterium efficiens YS-314]
MEIVHRPVNCFYLHFCYSIPLVTTGIEKLSTGGAFHKVLIPTGFTLLFSLLPAGQSLCPTPVETPVGPAHRDGLAGVRRKAPRRAIHPLTSG